MIPLLAVAAIGLLAGVALTAFWSEIKNFIQASVEKIKTVIIPSAIVGFRTYLETGSVAAGLYSAYKGIQKFYTRNTQGQWQETLVTRTIPDNEVPAEIRNKLKHSHTPVDITDDVQRELKLEA